jgi:hypothetical protein
MDFVRSRNHQVTTAFTRPNDTNAYTAGDVICDSTSAPTVMTFSGMALDKGGNGIIQQVRCFSSANVATKPDLQLFLFDTAPAAVNDNAAFAPSDAEMLRCVAVIAIPTTSFVVGNAGAGAAGNCVCDVQGLALAFNTTLASGAAGATAAVADLYGVLVVRNAYAPVAQEVFTFSVSVLD